ncbi:cytochrome P450 [Biscogniauxia mediterranea]|nr:cytochrome P450 [Biscogniauxia mediterranea]
MVSPSAIPSIEGWEQWIPNPVAVQTLPYFVTAILLVIGVMTLGSSKSNSDLPIVNPVGPFSLTYTGAKKTFRNSALKLLQHGKSLYSGKPFRMITDMGELIILPSAVADEIRNESKLSFQKHTYIDFHGKIDGFQGLSQDALNNKTLIQVARKQLTKSLSKVTEPLSEETTVALSLNLGESPEWRKIHAKPAILDIISRISSRVFLGDELCRNEDWLDITKSYTVAAFTAAQDLRLFPSAIRPFVHWFLPQCRSLRAMRRRAKEVIAPVIEKRNQIKKEAVANGQPVPKFNDAIEWIEEEALKPDYDPANFQLTLSVVAIHTSSDLMQQVIMDLAENPQYIQPLRDEVISVLRAEGWKKSALYNMKLLDSAIKESQRLKPITMASMTRYVTDDLTLSNGLHLKRGDRLAVDSSGMWDSSESGYADARRWDPYRFLSMRSEAAGGAKENAALLVATSAGHLGFGHGEHSCPGRFFAANEIKIALCHLLVKYDWKLAPGAGTAPDLSGLNMSANLDAELLIRRRQTVEIDVDSL